MVDFGQETKLEEMDCNGVIFLWCLYILYVVPSPYGIFAYLLFKMRVCVTYEGTKLHVL